MRRKKKCFESNRGITLIALIVTIIVLIILATISINAVVGENGIIKKAQNAKEWYNNGVISEEESMNTLLSEYENMMAGPPPPYKDDTLVVEPNVAEGMTKVRYNSNGKWERVTDDTTEWYNYANKEWANVVLSAETDGSSIFNADGTLDESKNYVQLVWIPRYAYRITSQYHQSGSTAGNISVVFIGTDNKGTDGTEYSTTYPTSATTGGSMGDYVVHPAFNYGGTPLAGFWIGKFESSNTSCTATDKATGAVAYTGDEVMTVKAGVTSWRNLTINNMYKTCIGMNKSGNPYGLNTSDNVVDPHLTKNDEWGAVAYLSKSSYGKETEEVWINPNSNYITGQAGTGASVSSTTSTNAYNTENGPNASTTGNVYGVYDMSGGAWEYTAAYVKNSNITSYGGNLVAEGTASKYRDVYSVGSSDSMANNYAVSTPANGHYGDAVYETCAETIDTNTYASSWYSDYSSFPSSSYPFFERGGGYSSTTGAGVFFFGGNVGGDNSSLGFRVVVPVL